MKTLIVILITIMLFSTNSFSQEIEFEKTFQITGEANIGDQPYIRYDEKTDHISVFFLLKNKNNNVNVETYKFDNAFNLINDQSEELSIPDARNKFPWWNYKGDKYSTEGISIEDKDELILKKKQIEYEYNWMYQTYDEKVNVLEKQTLKNADGDKYFHFRHWTSDDDSDNFLYILCGVKSKEDKYHYRKDFHLLKIDNTFNVVKDLLISFDYPQEIVFPRFVDEKTESRENIFSNDIILVFAPIDAGKLSDSIKNHFTYFSISHGLEVKDKIAFLSPSTCWSVEDKVIDSKSGDVFLFGASIFQENESGKNERSPFPPGVKTPPGFKQLGENIRYYDELIDTKKFTGFQVMKISDHAVGYLRGYSLDSMEGKIIKPASQKTSVPYEGKRFFISSYLLTSDGSLFIAGQNWGINTAGTMSKMQSSSFPSAKDREIKYMDCFGLGFDNKGELIGQYLYDTKSILGSGQKYSLFQFLFQGENPANIYWFLIQPNYWSWTSYLGVDMYDYRPSKPVGMDDLLFVDLYGFPYKFKCDLISSDFGKIDLNDKTISDFSNFQIKKEGKKVTAFFYLSSKCPFILTRDNKLILFGSQSMKSGKTLWFARISLK